MALVFSWAPTRTIDLSRLAYSSFLLVPKGYTADAHRKYWDYPFRDEKGRVSAMLLGRIAKRLAQEGTTETNAIVHRKLEVLVKKANEEAKRLGGNPQADWILKQLPSGNVYMDRRTREERTEVPAERRRLEPAEQLPAPAAPLRPAPAPTPVVVRAPLAAGAGASEPGSLLGLKQKDARAGVAARPRAAEADGARSSPPDAGALQGRKRLRKAAVVESDDERDAPPADGAAPVGAERMDVGGVAAGEGVEAGEEEAEAADDDDSSEDDADDDGEGVERLLSKCEKLASRMRGSLATFMQTDGAAEGGAGGVGLCAIEAAASASTVLGQPPNMSSQLVLKPYQLLGLNWLGALHANGLNGILADEMGLGKTVQLISLLAHLTHEAAQRGERAGPFLIITPTSTAENWARELAVWCPALVCAKYVGSEAERAQLREELREGHWDVLVTTYSLFERDSAAARDERSFLNKQRFEYAILDEAHCIKNAASARFRNLCRLSARRRVLLTGTPLENNLRELYTLLSFLMPALIGPAERDQLIAESARGASASLDAARRVMAPFVLRRLKSQVLTQLLLPKTERVEALRMDEPHARAYHAVLSAHAARVEAARAAAAAAAGGGGGGATGDAELDELIADAGQPLGSRRGEGREADGGGRARVQAALADKRWAKHAFTELRKAAQHPLLVRARYDGAALAKIAEVLWRSGHFGEDASHERVAEEVATLSDYRLHQLCAEHKLLHDFRLPDDALASSAKVRFLRALLPRLKAEGHRVVIFSQWTSVLDLLETLLLPGPAGLDLPYVRFDGSTSADDRQLLIDQFSSSDEVFAFLLTTRAGGVGINLTAADTVILHDVDFNPAIDRQAQDRVHRIGQVRPVTIYKLVTEGTVDEKIMALQNRKADMNDRILAGGDPSELTDESSVFGSILSDLLRERISPAGKAVDAEASPAADVAPAADSTPPTTSAPPVAAAAFGERNHTALATMPAEDRNQAAPSDAQLLAVLEPLVPAADSAEFAALTLKPLKRALVEQLGLGAKLSNEQLGKLISKLVEQRSSCAY